MLDSLREILAADPRIVCALAFGSAARGTSHAHSDVDVAIALAPDVALDATELGALTTRLEQAAGRRIDLVLLDEAPPGLAYRIFRDGSVLVVRDAAAFARRKAAAILEYLDFEPFESLFARGVLRDRAHGR